MCVTFYQVFICHVIHSSPQLHDDDTVSLQFFVFFSSFIVIQFFFGRFVVYKQNIVFPKCHPLAM